MDNLTTSRARCCLLLLRNRCFPFFKGEGTCRLEEASSFLLLSQLRPHLIVGSICLRDVVVSTRTDIAVIFTQIGLVVLVLFFIEQHISLVVLVIVLLVIIPCFAVVRHVEPVLAAFTCP